MEELARESVAALPNVSVQSGSWVSGLEVAEAGSVIGGVMPCRDLQIPAPKSPLPDASVVLLAMATHCLLFPQKRWGFRCFSSCFSTYSAGINLESRQTAVGDSVVEPAHMAAYYCRA
jgi:hypothetical protein